MSSATGQRVLTAAILIPIVVAAIWWGPTWLTALVAAAVAILALWEFFSVAEHQGFHSYRLWTSLAAVGIFGQQYYASRMASVTNIGEILVRVPRTNLEIILFGYVLGIAAIVLGTRRPISEVLPAISVSAAGLLFIVLPFSAVVRLHGIDNFGAFLLLFTLVIVWVGDTAAYFVGRSIGRWKLAPEVSPNKTWEGAIANFLGALLVAAIFGYWSKLPPIHMLAMAALGSVAGQVGDLFESAWKRSATVKDSGSLLPGHGGVLDRIDALILAAPAVWYYFEWVVWRRN
ncbi:MAG TPA: phosphatidate cytidylyltransferase [Candidatus Acidoferrales bacterium]|jgi:phosphatidate cytidylyltransferase|nr:phosphatidate cytidylyltransferase [Candidatus Acidoferrales bacterium]